MIRPYSHVQVGYAVLAGILVVLALVALTNYAATGAAAPPPGAAVFILVICALVAVLAGWMRISVDRGQLRWHFGPGLLRHAIPVDRIAGLEVVRNRWYYGFGVRRLREGWLYNVSGLRAVRIVLHDGTTLRLGTDEPDRLMDAIRAAQHRGRSRL